jgi:Icc-related predicted phosphoesterase
MPETFAFCTDIHGNMHAVDRFLEIAKLHDVDHVIFGGDIAPKRLAVELADGSGVSVDAATVHIGATNEAATALEHAGHILTRSTLTSEQLRKAIPIAQFLSQSYNVKRIAERPTSEEDLTIVRQILVPALRDYLTSRDGSVLLEKIRAASWVQGARDVTPDRVCEALSIEFGIAHVNGNSQITDLRERNRLMIENENANETIVQQKMLDTLQVWSIDVTDLIAECMRAGLPWHAWQRMAFSLDEYALEGQRAFVERLIARIRETRTKLQTVSIILGNDDHVELTEILDDAAHANHIIHATNRVVDLSRTTQILGYANVPPLNVRYNAWFRPEEGIAKDLEDLHRETREHARLIANIHCPPMDSILALGKKRDGTIDEFGSRGVRVYVDESKPHLVLTGHIHEPYTVNGNRFVEQHGNTTLINPGASEYAPRIAVGSIDAPTSATLVLKT